MIWVSVAILVGMRFKMSTWSGRMSWCSARYSVMTKMFSPSRVSVAGRASGMRMGMRGSFVRALWGGYGRCVRPL